jgi:hypothetical protein
MATPAEPVVPRPRKTKVEKLTDALIGVNGHDPILDVVLPPPPKDADDADLADWMKGAEALARMPARRVLQLTESIPDLRQASRAELDAKADRTDRFRWEPERMLDSGIGEKLGARVLAGVSTEPPEPLLIGRLDPEGHTILYGTGGVGKGTLAASWANGLLEDNKRILIADYENHPSEWARRIFGFGAGGLSSRILHVAPLTAAWGGNHGAIWKQADDLRELAVQFEADYLFIDSIVTACAGADPMKPESVSAYTGALEYIGLPCLSLGHTDKAENLRYPFGSIFWHNLARMTYSLKADGATVILQHRKHNNYEREPTRKVEVAWNAEGMPINVDETLYAEDLARRISSALIGRSLTVREICEKLDDEHEQDEEPTLDNSVRQALLRGAKSNPPRFVQSDKKWSNAL